MLKHFTKLRIHRFPKDERKEKTELNKYSRKRKRTKVFGPFPKKHKSTTTVQLFESAKTYTTEVYILCFLQMKNPIYMLTYIMITKHTKLSSED